MIKTELVTTTKKNLSLIEGVDILEEKFGRDNNSLNLKFSYDGKSLTLRIQDESSEESPNKNIFSINYIIRIRDIPKNKKEIDILRSINKYNEEYAVNKCILIKEEPEVKNKNKSDDNTIIIWFRSEYLNDGEVKREIIEDTIKSIKSAPSLLTSLIRDK